MNQGNGIIFPKGAAAIDNFLAAALHFGIAPLHGGEIQGLLTGSGGHRGGCAAPETDQHRRPPKHHQRVPRRQGQGLHMLHTHLPHASGQHDGLVITPALKAQAQINGLLKGAKIAE